ncbi:MAG: 3-hydroxyacyl-CoA dehydrogenase [Kordiimonadaceae bacterium]|nr:3-hydroxyacyl-CoA dehydrogenase [Kordiimonadaceae bacterium]MDC1428770.1 3-hydroxyacyl-CoA dehydrogenase NAD-binding domain-containing protein [Emcibacteraceae bacterium]
MNIVLTEIKENIAVVTIDNPPVNALSHAVRSGVSDAIQELCKDTSVKAIILICVGRTFCAGADISEFGKPPLSPSLSNLMAKMDQINKPLIAAIHGTALGGGFELALGCHYRIMIEGAKVGLPEVNLGLIPGAGGTQRLPRLIGVAAALEMITSGKPISARKAFEVGVVDRICDNNLLVSATKFAKDIIGKPFIKTSELELLASPEIFEEFSKKILKRTRGFLAPNIAISAVRAATEKSFVEGVKFEQECFEKLMKSPESLAQRHLFFAERLATKVPDIGKDTSIRKIEKIAIVGGGTMGCGIAISFLTNSIPVLVLEQSAKTALLAKSNIEEIINTLFVKGRLSENQKNFTTENLTISTEYSDLSLSDLVIEAVFEDMEIKKQVFQKIQKFAKQDVVMASNTSFLDLDEIASTTSKPQDVIGLHFFSPAYIMPLLEIIRTKHTSTDVLAAALKLGKLIGKKTVVSGVCTGFIANRMSSCYGREAGLLLLEGADPEQIDNVLYKFGMPMGMFSMLDIAGIDIGVLARKNIPTESFDERAFRIHEALVASGSKGQKTNAGFYCYNGKEKTLNPEVEALTQKYAEEYGIKRRKITPKEIEERCLFSLINEGFKIVEEGIAIRASDVDVVYTSAFGFPRYKGGPLHYAEHLGLDYILKRINKFAKVHGNRWWTPSSLLVSLVRENK